MIFILGKFRAYKIEYDDLGPGEFEIGISIPKEIMESNLEGLGKESHQLNKVFKTIKEVVEDDSSSIKFKTISSSDWQVFLNCIPGVAALLAVAIERIVALYKNHLEIKKIKLDLAERKLPKEVTKPLEDYLKEFVKVELQNIAKELIDDNYDKPDEGRKNELLTGLTDAFQYIAERIDKGATFEVRAEAPDEVQETKEGDKKSEDQLKKLAEYKETMKLVSIVNEKGRAITRLQKNHKQFLILPSEEGDEKSSGPKNQRKIVETEKTFD